ncbi:MAG TPA: NAD(P)-dependent oxidoreductase [Microbacterium sp.]|nr:NAD(P)-dependent oxidoreductase [Microbacterium sp.]
MSAPPALGTRDIAVIGAGRMGLPILRRLAAAGARVHAVDVDPLRREAAAAVAATVSGDVDATRDCDAVVTVLPHVQAFDDVAFGSGLVAHLRAGTVWIDLTSNDPRRAERAAVAHSSGPFVGAPMGGGPREAAAGELTFWVGADDESLAAARPVLTVLARPDGIQHVGHRVSDGCVFKLLSNALWFGQVTAVSESMAIAARVGIPSSRFAQLLAESAARSAFTDAYLPRLIDGDYVTDFAFASCVEELDLVDRLACDAGIHTPTMNATRDVHHRALERYGPVDGEMLAGRLPLDGGLAPGL